MKFPSEHLDIKLIAFDLDDTLLNDKRQITPRNLEALHKAADKGIFIVLCSGRAENGILPYVRQMNLAGMQQGRYLIAFNGASIYDLHLRDQIYKDFVDYEILKFVYEEAKKRGMASVIYDPATVYSWEDSKWARMDADMCGLKFKIVPDFEGFLKNGFPKLLVPSEPENVSAFKDFLIQELGDKADIFISKPYFLEVMSKGVGKGPSILKLAERLGISKCQTMAFGDSMNDESMLRCVEHSVAMSNGLEYIQKISRYTTQFNNNNDGIADFLERFVL